MKMLLAGFVHVLKPYRQFSVINAKVMELKAGM
jgi:hypothetical protein